MMTQFVKYIAKPGKAHAFVEEVERAGIGAKIRAEKGCVKYDYYYPAKDADTVLLIEQWVEPEDQDIHLTQPHMEDLRAIKKTCIEETIFGEDALK